LNKLFGSFWFQKGGKKSSLKLIELFLICIKAQVAKNFKQLQYFTSGNIFKKKEVYLSKFYGNFKSFHPTLRLKKL
jgi:hypothetical protein